MTRIAFVSTLQDEGPWGGSEELWSQAARGLVKQGCEVAVSVHGFPTVPDGVTGLIQAGCNVTFRCPGTIREKVVRRLVSSLAARWLDRVKPQGVVISQGANFDGVDWMLACLSRQVPYVTIVQAAIDTDFPEEERANRALRGYRGAVRCYFVSQGNIETTQRQIGARLPHALVVWNPFKVDYDANPPWPDETEFRLACVARLMPHAKAQDILFDVLRQEKWRQRPVKLTLYGDGSYRYALQRWIEEDSLTNISLAGHVQSIETIWATNHALILPSRFEGLPLAIVEALLCGRCCIVTDVAGNAELIQDGVTGFVASAPYPEAVDHAMERAWEMRAEWRQMGQAARAHARERVPRDPIAVFIAELKSALQC